MAMGDLAIIDSHIHLYAETHLSQLNWTADLPSDHILNRQNSVEDYKAATKQNTNLVGFIFLETDRKFGLDEAGWKDPLEEVRFLSRIARGHPIEGEGHEATDSRLLLGMVPWAPIPAGPNALNTYVSKIRGACGDEKAFALVKGFRYLVQDKPAGTMLHPDFISGLQWLGGQGFVFDLGVDLRHGGIGQLHEACTMLRQIYQKDNKLKVVINHFCKPNLHLKADEATEHKDFIAWAECIEMFASYSTIYMKLSGFFSELPQQLEDEPTPISQLAEQVKPWVDVVFSAFGPSRIMFGSDWPICSAGGPGSRSWQHWVDLVAVVLEEQGLSSEQKQRIWSGTAAEAYSINKPTF